MFEYRYPLLEVVQAIEELRESRGTTNKQICDFVRQQGRNPNDPMKILKTIRTLNKLVEEGVLIKKGKRYVFPNKPPEVTDNGDDCEEDQDQEQDPDSCDEDDDDDCDKDEEGDEGGEEGEEEEEGDEDDDDDEEEDDDDDDDDDEDDECEDKEEMPESESKPPSCPDKACDGQQKSPLGAGEPKPPENCGANEVRTDKITTKTSENIVTKKNSMKGGRKNGKGQNSETKNGKNKGGEAIAFCARDFIDSQYSQNSTQAKPVTLHEKPQDDLIEIENFDNEPVARAFGMRKRESKSRKSRAGNDCRSRSPIRGLVKNGFFTDLQLNHTDDLRKNLISSQIFQEVTDTPMDIDHDNEAVDLDYDILRHRSPIGPPSPITPGVHLDRTESCCSQPNEKSPENIKVEPEFDCKTQFFLKKNPDFKHSRHSMARAIDMQNKRLTEKDKEKHKRDQCSDEGNAIKAEKRPSLCSICEKKKRNS